MSQTTTTQTSATETIRLPSGQTITPKSNISIEADEIPIIDVSPIFGTDAAARAALASQIREASHRIGFFYAVNHGIPSTYAASVFEQARRFFALPMSEKMKVDTALVPDEYVGYHVKEGYNRNNRKHQDLSEAFNWAYDAQYDPDATAEAKLTPSISIWPDSSNLPNFKEDLYSYHTQLLQFARQLTRIFALALHLDESFFDDYIQHPEAGMRILHYPSQTAPPADQNGIGAHTDFECFTMVTQDSSGGLEVLSKESGYWIKARPIPDSFVVNIADCLMRQTNDFFVSTVHRVINNQSGAERYSIPFFWGFDRKKVLEPVPTCVSEGNPFRYPVMTSGEYYKYRATNAKAGGY